MALNQPSVGGIQTVKVKVSIPELSDIGPFWIPDYGTHHTFDQLLQDCVNHDDVLQSRYAAILTRVRASRHFWCGERMMRRSQALADLQPKNISPGIAGASDEISLVLRPDYYRVGPPQYMAPDPASPRGEPIEYTYLDAEIPIKDVIALILNKEEKRCCFDLCSYQRKRLHPGKTLADYGLWPAWLGTPESQFPARAVLTVRPRASWLAYVLLGLAAVLGLLIGFFLLRALLH